MRESLAVSIGKGGTGTSAAVKPASVKAVLRPGSRIILVTENGNLHVEVSATARKQLLKILDA